MIGAGLQYEIIDLLAVIVFNTTIVKLGVLS